MSAHILAPAEPIAEVGPGSTPASPLLASASLEPSPREQDTSALHPLSTLRDADGEPLERTVARLTEQMQASLVQAGEVVQQIADPRTGVLRRPERPEGDPIEEPHRSRERLCDLVRELSQTLTAATEVRDQLARLLMTWSHSQGERHLSVVPSQSGEEAAHQGERDESEEPRGDR